MDIEEIKNNQTLKWAVDKFVKVGLGLFLVSAVILILQKIVGFTFDISAGMGL